MNGISHNLHLALDRHNKMVKEDIKAALIEYTRSTLSYERQRLREMEALLPDIEVADSKALPATGPIRPSVVPKLDEGTSRSSEGLPPRAEQVVPSKVPSSFGPLHGAPALPSKSNIPPPLTFQSSNASSSTSANPQIAQNSSPVYGRADHPASAPVPHTPTSAGPSGHAKTERAATTLPTSGPLHSAPPTQNLANTSTPPKTETRVYHEPDPLGPLGPTPQTRRTIVSNSFASPLEPSATLPRSRTNDETRAEIDPLGLGKPSQLSQSVRTPTKSQRPRLDAREAASKLANIF